MNTRSTLLSGSVLTTTVILSSIGFAQPIFNFDVEYNGLYGDTNVEGVASEGTVDFLSSPGEVNVNIWNTTGAPHTDSVISGFYILRPMGTQGSLVDASLTSGPANWINDGGNFNLVLNFAPGVDNNDEYLFFGAEVSSSPENNGIQQGSNGLFTFDLDESGFQGGETIDWDGYGAVTDKPHILIRWQSIVGGDAGSAGGYGQFTPVPEPSQIAALSIVGLGALLMIRRRIKAKRAAKA